MKKILLFLMMIVVICSCTSIPEPKNDSDSLVIGSLVWAFPDGFFDDPPVTLANSLTLTLVNLRTSEKLKVKVSESYFHFVCKGGDKFILQQVMYESPDPTLRHKMGYELNLQLDTKPQMTVYTGFIRITFASPEFMTAKEGDAMIRTYYRFRQSYTIENKLEEMKKYLAEKDTKNSWGNYEIYNLYEN